MTEILHLCKAKIPKLNLNRFCFGHKRGPAFDTAVYHPVGGRRQMVQTPNLPKRKKEKWHFRWNRSYTGPAAGWLVHRD
jgi:hypothetical protein